MPYHRLLVQPVSPKLAIFAGKLACFKKPDCACAKIIMIDNYFIPAHFASAQFACVQFVLVQFACAQFVLVQFACVQFHITSVFFVLLDISETGTVTTKLNSAKINRTEEVNYYFTKLSHPDC